MTGGRDPVPGLYETVGTDDERGFLELHYKRWGPRKCAEVLGVSDERAQQLALEYGLIKRIIKRPKNVRPKQLSDNDFQHWRIAAKARAALYFWKSPPLSRSREPGDSREAWETRAAERCALILRYRKLEEPQPVEVVRVEHSSQNAILDFS